MHAGDVNLKEHSLLVRSGKGAKSRVVYVCDEAVVALREWLAVRPPDAPHDWLWTIDCRRRMYDRGLTAIIIELKCIAGLRDKSAILPHAMRHACATRLMRNGADIRSIQSFLGHTMLTTTTNYLHTDEHHIRNLGDLTSMKPGERRSLLRRTSRNALLNGSSSATSSDSLVVRQC